MLATSLMFFTSARAQEHPPGQRPNVVFILADDLGWRDLGSYGSTFYETPNIDRLAEHGMRFTQAYAAHPLCSPTRASLLTGRYPARYGLTTAAPHLQTEYLDPYMPATAPPDRRAVTPRAVTRLKQSFTLYPELFQEEGYVTGHFGKWHLGRKPYDPINQGFDIDIPRTPAPGPLGGYIGPWAFWREVGPEANPPIFWRGAGEPGEHLEDRMAQEATRFIRKNKDKPFLLHYWAFSVHTPYEAKPELVEKYRGRADSDDKQRNALYAAMVQSLDEAVGTLIQTLEEEGLADDTIIVFLSDNGGVDWAGHAGISEYPKYFREIPITDNAPLREGKGSVYEGGIRVPLIVDWPGVTRPGAESDALISTVDFYPTFLKMAGLAMPPNLKLDGSSFAPVLEGEKSTHRNVIFTHYPQYLGSNSLPATAMRKGDWKLIRFYAAGPDQSDRYELYNLEEDIGETDNLARGRHEKVEELKAVMSRMLDKTEAIIPFKNPAYDPDADPLRRTPPERLLNIPPEGYETKSERK